MTSTLIFTETHEAQQVILRQCSPARPPIRPVAAPTFAEALVSLKGALRGAGVPTGTHFRIIPEESSGGSNHG